MDCQIAAVRDRLKRVDDRTRWLSLLPTRVRHAAGLLRASGSLDLVLERRRAATLTEQGAERSWLYIRRLLTSQSGTRRNVKHNGHMTRKEYANCHE